MSKELAERVFGFFCANYLHRYHLKPADALFVFGRNDSDLAYAAQVLHADGIVKKVLVTGGIGKDAGDLSKLGLSEAHYLSALMYDLGVPADDILIESKATNGGENSRLGLQMIHDAGVKAEKIILLAHPSNALRLMAVHTFEARNMGFEAKYQLAVCDWDFDAENISHQNLVIGECLSLIEWPLRKNAAGESDPWSDPVYFPQEIVVDVLAWKAAQAK